MKLLTEHFILLYRVSLYSSVILRAEPCTCSHNNGIIRMRGDETEQWTCCWAGLMFTGMRWTSENTTRESWSEPIISTWSSTPSCCSWSSKRKSCSGETPALTPPSSVIYSVLNKPDKITPTTINSHAPNGERAIGLSVLIILLSFHVMFLSDANAI